jgi:hypothetical protein
VKEEIEKGKKIKVTFLCRSDGVLGNVIVKPKASFCVLFSSFFGKALVNTIFLTMTQLSSAFGLTVP